MKIDLPDIKILIKNILPTSASFFGDFVHPLLGKTATQSIGQRSLNYLEEIKLNNSKSDIGKFNVFITSLLLRSASAESGGRLYKELEKNIRNYNDVDTKNIKDVLKIAMYRFPPQGLETILSFKDLFLKRYQGRWDVYLNEAKTKYKDNFVEDELLSIKGVGLKVRDLALSCFLKEYSANDIHVVRVLVRTGLFVHGYGDIDIGTNPNKKEDYLFMRKLIIRLSGESDFSPGELDRIFWHFGRTVCKKKPDCQKCLVKNDCLTYKNKS